MTRSQFCAGYVNISVSDINGRHPNERWYQVFSATVGRSGRESRSDTPSVRIKARYQAVGILPQRLYDPLVDVSIAADSSIIK
jgi:hypothetical protein